MDLSTVRHIQALRKAEADVQPYVGPVMGMDSAGCVYRKALTLMGHDVKNVPLTEMGVVFEAIKGQRPRPTAATIAMDAKSAETFKERFPEGNRLSRFGR